HLTVGGLALPLAVVLAIALWLGRWAPPRQRQASDTLTPPGPFPLPLAAAAPGLFACRVAGAAAVGWAWPHLVGATRLWIWDDYTYHMVYPALWLRERAIAAVTPVHAFTMQAWYP